MEITPTRLFRAAERAEQISDETKKSEAYKAEYNNIQAFKEISKLMCKNGKVEFISCSSFAGEDGRELFHLFEGVFGKGNVSGYAFPVRWGFYSGDVYRVIEKPNPSDHDYMIEKERIPRAQTSVSTP